MNDHNGQLKSYVERVKALEIEKRERAEDIKEVLAEAKEHGLNPAAIRAVVKDALRSNDQKEKQQILKSTIDEYKAAVGGFVDTDLGRAALNRLSA